MVKYPLGGDMEYRGLSKVVVLVLHPRLLPSLLLRVLRGLAFPQKHGDGSLLTACSASELNGSKGIACFADHNLLNSCTFESFGQKCAFVIWEMLSFLWDAKIRN